MARVADTSQHSANTHGSDDRYGSAGEGASELQKGFEDWSRQLTDRSLHASYAVIGAAWAIFGTADYLFNNAWALWAVGLAIAYVGLALAVSSGVVSLYLQQLNYSQADPKRWKIEYEDSANPDSFWPYTKGIDRVPRWYNRAKLWIPGAAVLCLIIAIAGSYSADPEEEPKSKPSIERFH